MLLPAPSSVVLTLLEATPEFGTAHAAILATYMKLYGA